MWADFCRSRKRNAEVDATVTVAAESTGELTLMLADVGARDVRELPDDLDAKEEPVNEPKDDMKKDPLVDPMVVGEPISASSVSLGVAAVVATVVAAL